MTSNAKVRQKNVQITDLDQSDTQQQNILAEKKAIVYRKHQSKRPLMTMTGNFNRRSRSVECTVSPLTATDADRNKLKNHFNELLLVKDKQMEQLLERVSTLHNYNEQFANDNQKLRQELSQTDKRLQSLQDQVDSCEKCRKLSQELVKSEAENKSFETDLCMMKTLVYRLNMQIEKYQDDMEQLKCKDKTNPSLCQIKTSTEVLPQQQQQELKQESSNSHISPWQSESVCTHTLAPLLKSYDEMIHDKDELIQQYRYEFDQFAGELKRSLEQNNQLLEENDNLKRDVHTWSEERLRLQTQVNVCRSKAELQTRKTDLAKEKLMEVMECYEKKVQTMALDLEHLHAAYGRCKSELITLKSANTRPQEDAIATSLQECKDLLAHLKDEHGKEKESWERNLRELNERNLDSQTKLTQLQQEHKIQTSEKIKQDVEVEELKTRNSSLKRSIEQVNRSRDRLKARLRIALQWAQKLEQGQADVQNTWEAVKRLETIVKHKESQVRGLQSRHIEEIDKLEKKLTQKEETIRTILKGRIMPHSAQ
ncbi:protein Cep89 homolog [Teleopsis dalmanni]|uniref:protein Cep89 homolog n=1 Tax=Teleopsis dalmanni TaxID=139649 RepID=UPI000D329D1C|nr:protein Cep89 homolog [Teleopsis dalmanni]